MVRAPRAFVAVALAALALAGAADAITREQANAVALRVLKPQALKGPTILFGLPKTLGARQVVVEAGSKSLAAKPFIPKGAPVGRKAWLFWLDQAAYARFLHPSRLLLVDDAGGKVLRNVAMSLYPLVDGKRPGFLTSWKAYASSRFQVFTNLPKSAARASARSATPALARAVPPGAFKDDCLISLGLRDDPLFSGDFTGVVGWAQKAGLRAFRAPNGPGGRPPGGAELAAGVTDLVDKKGCKDVMIFISGHGYPGPKYVPALQTGDVAGAPWIGVTAASLQAIVRAHPRTTFKLKLNGCYSGRFVEPLGKEPNLLVLETAAGTSEYSWGPLPRRFRHPDDGREIEVPERVNPGRSEFVNGNLAGLEAFFASAEEVARAQEQGGSLLARALARAFDLGASSDGARRAGLTHPQLHANLGFEVTLLGGYRHLGATSEVCGLFGTKPAQPGASYTVGIAGPGVVGGSTKTGTTGSLGEGGFSFPINAYGTYTVTVTVTGGPGGIARKATVTVVVTAAEGECP